MWISVFSFLFFGFWPTIGVAQSITVFAASSLRDALGTLSAEFEGEGGGNVTLVFAASSAIARQVAQGAPADVVLLADEDWGTWLVDQGALEATVPFASNRLVLASRDWVSVTDQTIGEVLAGELIAMAQVDSVPAGRYGKAALEALGLWDDVETDVVQAANVRAAWRFVQRAEVTFGIGYASDLVALPDLQEVYGFDPDSHPDVIYVGAAVSSTGAQFMDYLQSPTAAEILGDWGFAPRPEAP